MLAFILITGVLAAGPLKIRVDVNEFAAKSKSVPGAKVTLRETTASTLKPVELHAITDTTGRAWFSVPHLGFDLVEIEKQGYVTRAEMKPFLKYEQWSVASLELYPGLQLGWSYDELTDWEKRRSVFSRGSCSAALATTSATRSSCSLKTPDVEQWWQGYHRPLLDVAPRAWYELSNRVRKLAPKYGKKDRSTSDIDTPIPPVLGLLRLGLLWLGWSGLR